MSRASARSNLDDLIRRYASARSGRDERLAHWVCLPVILFAVLGLLFTLNFGIALIAIAVATLYYSRYGELIAAQLGALLLAMLAAWMMLMPAHHLISASLVLLAAGLAGWVRGQIGPARRDLSGLKQNLAQYLLAGPVYAARMLRDRVAKGEDLLEQPRLDPG